MPVLISGWTTVRAQITITAASGPQIGDTVPRLSDNSPNFGPGLAGPSRTWNFTAVTATDSPTTRVITPGSTPFAGAFPGSNLAMTTDNAKYLYLTFSATNLVLKGLAGDLLNDGNNISAVFNPAPVIQQYPIMYGNTFMDSYGFNVTTSGTTWGFNQIRMKRVAAVRDTIDAWGAVTTPVGTYNCLRHKHIDNYIDTIWVKLFSFSPWTIYQTNVGTAESYSWLGEESGLAIAELSLDSARQPERFTWTLVPPVPQALFAWTDSGNGNIGFTDLSGNSPTMWTWDFGDGSPASNVRNASHIYASNGSYHVCMTAANVTGSDVFCDSVLVTSVVSSEWKGMAGHRLLIAPNPAIDLFDIVISGANSPFPVHLSIFDIKGRLVMEEVVVAFAHDRGMGLRVNCSHLPAGLYSVLAVLEGMPQQQGKLLIAR